MKYRFAIPAIIWITLGALCPGETPTAETGTDPIYESARTLLKGSGGKEEKRKGFELMKQAADRGHLPAVAGIAYLYTVGLGVTKDTMEAGKWLEIAAERGHLVSQYNLGKLLISDEIPLPSGALGRDEQHTRGVEWLRKAADKGFNEAKADYGIILMRGDFKIKADPATAARTYLIPAAAKNHVEALNALGILYQMGDGVDHLPAEAERCFREAAMGGNVKAQANLGEHLDPMSTDGARRIESLAWLYLAEESKDPVAMKILQNKMSVIAPQDTITARRKASELRKQIRKDG